MDDVRKNCIILPEYQGVILNKIPVDDLAIREDMIVKLGITIIAAAETQTCKKETKKTSRGRSKILKMTKITGATKQKELVPQSSRIT